MRIHDNDNSTAMQAAQIMSGELPIVAELRAQLAAAQAQVAERDAVLRALGYDEERYKLAAWAAGKGMRYKAYEGFWCSQAPHAVFNCHHEKDGSWWLAHCGWRHFSAGQHEAAWAAFNAAGGNDGK